MYVLRTFSRAAIAKFRRERVKSRSASLREFIVIVIARSLIRNEETSKLMPEKDNG